MLRYVLVSFGKDVGYGPTLAAALDDVLGVTGSEDSLSQPEETPSGGTGNQPGGGTVPDDVTSLLRQAEEAFAAAEQALQDKDLQGYADASERARDLVEQALRAADQARVWGSTDRYLERRLHRGWRLDRGWRPTEAVARPGVAQPEAAARAGDRRHSVSPPLDLAGTASVPQRWVHRRGVEQLGSSLGS